MTSKIEYSFILNRWCTLNILI